MTDDLGILINRLSEAKNVVALTGAGVSAESGIKTFRDPDGLWSKFNPMELASVEGFMKNSDLVWSWYRHRVDVINNSQPNAGHYALAEIQKLNKFEFTLITQNVDGLHQKSGSYDVVELHGSIIRNKCFDCNEEFIDEIDSNDVNLQRCGYCSGKIRPDVVWFGEMLPRNAILKAENAAINSDVFFSIGTSAEVFPAADLPIISKNRGSLVVEINPNRTRISDLVDIYLPYTSAEILPIILNELKGIN